MATRGGYEEREKEKGRFFGEFFLSKSYQYFDMVAFLKVFRVALINR